MTDSLERVIDKAGQWYMGEWVALPEHVATAVRKWVRDNLPKDKELDKWADDPDYGYSQALSDVRKNLGVE